MIKVDHILGPKGFVQNIFGVQFMSASNIKLISSVLIRQLSIRYPIIAQNYAKFENRKQYIPFYSLNKICMAGCNAILRYSSFSATSLKGRASQGYRRVKRRGGGYVEVESSVFFSDPTQTFMLPEPTKHSTNINTHKLPTYIQPSICSNGRSSKTYKCCVKAMERVTQSLKLSAFPMTFLRQ